MTLKQYINGHASIKELSKAIGVIPTTLYRYMDGTRTPRPAIALKIVAATGGKVSLEALYN